MSRSYVTLFDVFLSFVFSSFVFSLFVVFSCVLNSVLSASLVEIHFSVYKILPGDPRLLCSLTLEIRRNDRLSAAQ